MTETTPEEITEDWLTIKMRDPAFVKGFIDEMSEMHKDEIRAAVKAERERCAMLAGWEVRAVSCNTPDCLAPPGKACRPDGQGRSHANRWRAAIRQKPDVNAKAPRKPSAP